MNGPPILLLHGWGGSFASTWAANGWRDAFLGRELIELDLPGHGAHVPSDTADYADLAGAVGACLPDGALDVIAYSLGAKIALALACSAPGRLRHLVLSGIGDNVFAPEPSAEPLAQALTGETPVDRGSAIAALVCYSSASGADRHALAAVLRRSPNPVIEPAALARVGNALLVNGSADRIAQPDRQLRAALSRAHYLCLADVDHLSLPANPDFRAAATAFVMA